MNLKIELLRKEKIELFSRTHDLAFDVHSKYFKDGIFPEPTEDDKEYDLNIFIDKTEYIFEKRK